MSKFNSFIYDLVAACKSSVIISGRCTAKFKLPARYKNEVAPFGFDWVRTGDSTDNVGMDIPYKGNVGRYYADKSKREKYDRGSEDAYFSPSPSMYKQLCRSYAPGNLILYPAANGKMKSYHVPVVSIYPYHAVVNPHQVACLTLEIEIQKEVRAIHLEYDKASLQIDGADTLRTEQGKHTYEIEIKSIKELEEDHYIHVIATNRKGKTEKAGMLRIAKNAKRFRYSVNILLVNVKFLASSTPTAPVLTGNSDCAAEYIARFLKHALITPHFETMELDLQDDNEINSRLFYKKGILYLEANKTNRDESNNLVTEETLQDIVFYLQEQLKAVRDTSQFRVIVFCMGVRLMGQEEQNRITYTGYCINETVILKKSYKGDTAAHETLHALNLGHSFDRLHKEIKHPATYKVYTTDNIMDYSATTINWWEWQWKIVRQSCFRER